MELKVWVDGIQRIVCGVTELTTCQEVVIALAQAIGRTGRYTLIERWRETERHLAPHDHPVVSLNKWGQYANDVQLVLERTSLSPGTWSVSEFSPPSSEFYPRQNLSPLAKLRPLATDSIKRCESKLNSLTFSGGGGTKGLREIFSKGRELSRGRGRAATPGPVAQELGRLVQLQKKKLHSLEQQLHNCEQEIQWQLLSEEEEEEEEEVQLLEQRVQQMETEVQEQVFWENELWLEQKNERQLRQHLQQLHSRVQDCEAQLTDYLAQIQHMEVRLQAERHRVEAGGEEELWVQMEKVGAELEAQVQQAVRLESSCRAVELSVGQFNLQLQRKEQELQQLTKELRHVNLQNFIQQTGTKAPGAPTEPSGPGTPTDPGHSASLKNLGLARRLSSDLQTGSLTSTLHPDGIYV